MAPQPARLHAQHLVRMAGRFWLSGLCYVIPACVLLFPSCCCDSLPPKQLHRLTTAQVESSSTAGTSPLLLTCKRLALMTLGTRFVAAGLQLRLAGPS